MDFSRYGGPSEEWKAVESSIQPLPPMDLLERKKVTNQGREKVAADEVKELAPHLQIRDHPITTRDGSIIEGRTFKPLDIPADEKLPLYLHFHGGGFLFGTLASEDAICARIALHSKVLVFNVNYRHTPDFIYPTAWHDTQDAFEWAHTHVQELSANPSQITVGGISAGGQLAASLTLQQHLGKIATSCPPIVGQILMIPCLAHMDCYAPLLAQMKDPSVSSTKENEFAPILSIKVAKMFTDLLQVKDAKIDDLMLNPGNATAEQVQGLPPTVFGIAGLDPLRDEALLYAKRLTEAG